MKGSLAGLRRPPRGCRPTKLILPGALALVGMACADQGALVPEEEPLVPEAEIEALIEVLGVVDSFFSSEAWDALREAGEGMLPPPALSPIAANPPASRSSDPTAVGGSQLIPAVPKSTLGQTMVYSASAGKYVVDPSRRGAPGDGVRLVLYQPRRNRLRELGWMDIRDTAPASPNSWQVSVLGVERGRTFANYTSSVSGPATAGLLRPTRIDLDGLVIAGPSLLRFDIDSHVPDPLHPTLDINWEFGFASLGFAIEAAVSGVPISGQGVENLDFTILFRGFRWRVLYNDRGGVIDATVGVNGKELATTTGVISQPTIIGSAGRTVSPRTRFLIIRMLFVASGVFETHNDLFTPPGAVVFLGL